MRIFSILFNAFSNTKNIFSSIFGTNIKDDLYSNELSEINLKNWNLNSFLKLLSDIFLIKLPIYCPKWMPNIIKRIFFGQNSRYIKDEEEIMDKVCFIYLNGILSNYKTVCKSQEILKKKFNRPINLIHNVTDSLLMDLIECLIGKETNELTEPSMLCLSIISQKLLSNKIDKVVLICHSQGTIIAANMLRNLKRFGLNKKKYLKKLEIYAFANCATKMVYGKENYPYMESFANDNDIVAKMGCNCGIDLKSNSTIEINGNIFVTPNKSGHMFNSHYMNNFDTEYPRSKLLTYLPEKINKNE